MALFSANLKEDSSEMEVFLKHNFSGMFFAIIVLGLNPTLGRAEDAPSAPPVAGQVLTCSQWQLSFETNTWGCLIQPRPVSVAVGYATEAVIKDLYTQIKILEERLRHLEGK
jgi:hypothetical protein